MAVVGSSMHIRILVVDDDWTSLSIVSSMLRKWSYEVVTVKSPVDAIATLRKKQDYFDLIVTDLHMPIMNGTELTKQINLEFKNIPVVLMSADDKESVILECLASGAVYYIIKPINPEDLKNMWQYAAAARKGKSPILEEIMENVTLEDLENLDVEEELGHGSLTSEDNNSVSLEDMNSSAAPRTESGERNKRKAVSGSASGSGSRDEQEEMSSAGVKVKKARVIWTTVLHNLFLQAVRHLGLGKAVPKKILEFMSVPGLTRENVASHLQKYRLFLKRVAMRNAYPTRNFLSERALRSSFAAGHPSLLSMSRNGQLYTNNLMMRSSSYNNTPNLRLSTLGPPLFPRNLHQGQGSSSSRASAPLQLRSFSKPAPSNFEFGAGSTKIGSSGRAQNNNLMMNLNSATNSLRLYPAQRNYLGNADTFAGAPGIDSSNFNLMGSQRLVGSSSTSTWNSQQRNYNGAQDYGLMNSIANANNVNVSGNTAPILGNQMSAISSPGFGNANQFVNPTALAAVENGTASINLGSNLGVGQLGSATSFANANQLTLPMQASFDQLSSTAGINVNEHQLNPNINAISMSGSSSVTTVGRHDHSPNDELSSVVFGGPQKTFSFDDLMGSTGSAGSTSNNSNNYSAHSNMVGDDLGLSAIFLNLTNNPSQQQDKEEQVLNSNGLANQPMNGDVNFDDLPDLFPMELENASLNDQSLAQKAQNQSGQTNFGSSTPYQFGDNNVLGSFAENPSQNQVGEAMITDYFNNNNNNINNTAQLNNGYQLNFDQQNTNQNQGMVNAGLSDNVHQLNDYNASFAQNHNQNPGSRRESMDGDLFAIIQNFIN